MKDLSVEYAHIYTNSDISEEQRFSLEILSKTKNELKKKDKSFSFVVLVDDYSFPDPTFDYASFVTWLSKEGYKPDFIFRESQLIPVCDEVIRNVKDEKIKNQLVEYIKTKKYPCSLFIAAWYLVRLGNIKHPLFKDEIIAKEILNILPESFKPFEEKALEIIANTSFAGQERKIKYEYFKGRTIA